MLDLTLTELGSGEELVVFVHGVFDRGRAFARVARLLDSECRMRWYDRRGYGTSANADADPVGVHQHVADLVAVLDGEPAVLVGHSFGGLPVLGAAALAPTLVRSLVLYESVIAWAPTWADRTMAELLADPNAESAGLSMMLGDRYREMSAAGRRRLSVEARSFVTEERSTRLGSPPFELSHIRSPVVYGVSDLAVFQPIVEFLESKGVQLEVVELRGADHFAHRGDPERFASLVRRGLQRANGATPSSAPSSP